MASFQTSGPRDDADIAAWIERIGVPGLIDLHVHFMPDAVQRKVWAFFDHLGEDGGTPWPIHYRLPESERLTVLWRLGLRAFTTLNYAHRPGMAQWLNDHSTGLARANDDVIHSATFFPEEGVDQVVAQAIDDGARVFKVHIQVGRFSPVDDRLDGAWQLVARAGAPVVMHCGNGPHSGEHTGIGPVRELVARHPDLIVVVAHCGLPEYAAFAELAREHPNVFLDTTMVGTDYMEQLAPTPPDFPEVMAGLAGKVVLGTDFPTIPYAYAHQLAALDRWGLGDDWLAGVVWHTPRRLLRLSG